MSLRRVCVFCGSRPGARSEFLREARGLGRALAQNGLTLVYGGASIGVMGAVADAALELRGAVIGVIPQRLKDREIAHGGLTELRVVGSMHERKATMESLSDGFIALPGGFGTFEELFEIITWAQLGLHHKPIGVLNVAGYYDPLRMMIQRAVEEGFVPQDHAERVLFANAPDVLVAQLMRWTPAPLGPKVIDRTQT